MRFSPCLENPFQSKAHHEDEKNGHDEEQGERFTIQPQDLQLLECDGADLLDGSSERTGTPFSLISKISACQMDKNRLQIRL